MLKFVHAIKMVAVIGSLYRYGTVEQFCIWPMSAECVTVEICGVAGGRWVGCSIERRR